MNEFKNYHPIINFLYFALIIGFSCFFMHPFFLFVSLLCAFTYSIMIKGRKTIKATLLLILPIMILTSLINPAFNHEGATIIAYFPNGNPLTAESVVYGLFSATMIASVICWFSCFNEIITSDKLIYLFGKILPSLSLIISMTLRFVPKFTTQIKAIINAQRCIGKDITSGSLVKRAKSGMAILSIMLTNALENSIESADSMKARGYGLPNRTAFSIFTFDKRDKVSLSVILILGIYIITGYGFGKIDFSYFPTFYSPTPSFFGISVFIAYLFLCSYPIVIEISEVLKWNVIKSKN